jgi:hypothetical protein
LFNASDFGSGHQELRLMTLNDQSGGTFDPATFRLPTFDEKKGVKEETPIPPLPPSNADFVRAIFGATSAGAVALVCTLSDDPSAANGWPPMTADDVNRQCPAHKNNYFNCSTFRPLEGGGVKATKDQFEAYHALVLDDVGTKVSADALGSFVPTWRLETSPNNYQVGIRVQPPLRDAAEVETLQAAVKNKDLSDRGAFGLARWARLPVAINGKAKHLTSEGFPFVCRLKEWNPASSYTVDEILAGLDLEAPMPERAPAPSLATPGDDDVCVHAKPENPVLTALRSKGAHKREIEPGKHEITCPWVSDHTDATDTGACYWEPDTKHRVGGFRCLHAHCDQRNIRDLISILDVSPADARNKIRIRVAPGSLNRVIDAAEEALAATGRIFQAGASIVSVRKHAEGGDVSIEPLSEQALTRELADAAEWEQFSKSDGGWRQIDPPFRIVGTLHKAQSYNFLRPLRGLAWQPYFRAQDGQLVIKPGYDELSMLYASFDPGLYKVGDTTRAAAEVALSALLSLIDEFHFSTQLDRSVALSALLTAAVRPSLRLSPAYNLTAPSPGSGKSYLAGVITKFATSGTVMNASYPPNAGEATKAMVALLMTGPAAIVFDDLQSNWQPYPSINRALTSQTISERLLGGNKTITVGTQVLILGTGNNVEPIRDLRRRVLTIRLAPQVANPALMTYKKRPLEIISRNREAYVCHALTLIEAWRAAGSPRENEFDVASFGDWSDLCRLPLIWLGQPDPATRLSEQLNADPDSECLSELLTAWFGLLGDRPTTVRALLDAAAKHAGNALQLALDDLPFKDGQGINRSMLGWYLKKNSGRIVNGLKIVPAMCSDRRGWRIAQVFKPIEAIEPT